MCDGLLLIFCPAVGLLIQLNLNYFLFRFPLYLKFLMCVQ